MMLSVDDTVHPPNADWSTSRPEQRRTSPGTGEHFFRSRLQTNSLADDFIMCPAIVPQGLFKQTRIINAPKSLTSHFNIPHIFNTLNKCFCVFSSCFAPLIQHFCGRTETTLISILSSECVKLQTTNSEQHRPVGFLSAL